MQGTKQRDCCCLLERASLALALSLTHIDCEYTADRAVSGAWARGKEGSKVGSSLLCVHDVTVRDDTVDDDCCRP